MPELPEVETVVRGLRGPLLGRTIRSAWLDWPNSLAHPTPDEFTARIAGQRVQRIDRRGKYILITLDDAALIIHLKMTGRLYVTPDDAAHDADRWVHFRFQLDNAHQLRFSDARKFGRVILTPDPAWVIGRLGPEPLEEDFTLDVFRARLAPRSGVLKPLLLNQSFIAGIGNIYADEALFRAGLHPLRSADSLTTAEQEALYTSIRAALAAGIDHEGASINWYRKPDGTAGDSQNHLFAYGRTGQPCQRCGTPIERIVVGQRATHYCPTCQQR
ncbi:MAG: DNA-formamidopyrimidine glycosylase [Anaerolineae bacterium]|nr:DNA-formamidopyrimidine glycosylase [Anaerolineae bacterium]